ncbi:FtsX-like permease family protein [Ornithinimicrobium sp. W1679]|uniref:FtsX-like permease family protein n=1 Tax=Ornithinimicrobium sp. W1679 TaxID=3418770 RepID=UPI003CE81A83
MGTWRTAGLASRGRRLLSAAVAIVIGVTFLAASLALLTTAQRGMEDAVAAGVRDADLVLTVEGEGISTAGYDVAAALEEVASVRGETVIMAEVTPQEWVAGAPVPTTGVTLLEGRMPGGAGEVVVNSELAEDVAVGERLEVTVVTLEEAVGRSEGEGAGGDGSVGAGDPSTSTDLETSTRETSPRETSTRETSTGPAATTDRAALDVVGVADFGDTAPMLSYGPAFAADDATLRLVNPGLTYGSVMVELVDGADAAAAREALAGAVPGATLQTGAEAAAERVAVLTGGTDVIGAILLGFGAVALLTAAIVIANTFTITLAQRTGELALLRAVGATKRQVRSLVVLEAVLLGLVSSAVGVGIGLVAALGLLAVGDRLDLGLPLPEGLELTPVVLGVPLLVGLVVTVLASLWPAVRATRVSPLAALRPSGPSGERQRVGVVRVVLAVVLLGTGVAAMVYAATSRDMLSGVVGGVVSFVGVLVAAVVVVPAAVRALGLGARAAGVPGRLAVDNAVRNPGRAAATSAALVVGVTLITMTSVGAASGQRTAMGEIDESYSVDLVLSAGAEYAEAGTAAGSEPAGGNGAGGGDGGGGGNGAGGGDGGGDGAGDGNGAGSGGTEGLHALPVPADVPDRVAAVDGVATARVADTAYLTLGEEDGGGTAAVGIDPARDGDVVRGDEQLAALVPGTVGMADGMLSIYALEPGDRVEVSGSGGRAELEVVPFALGYDLAVNVEDLAALGGDAVAPGTVLVRLADGADVADVMGAVSDVADEQALQVAGSAAERAVITQVLDVLVLVTTALLGVAVLIAVVGIANTLSLSVLERHREHALLRGLGLTRGQMRSMLLVEGVLLALVSALIGLGLGLGYAALGVQTLLPEDVPLKLAVPWSRVGLIVGVALLAGVLASVLPARRAVRVSPAEGLATG